MALKVNKQCRTCAAILEEAGDKHYETSKLYQLISEYHLGKRPLKDVARAYTDLRYLPMRNHALKHQNVTKRRLAKTKVETLEKQSAYIGQAKIHAPKHHSERRSKILEWIENEIDEGNVKPTAAAIVALLKQESDIELKQTDQTLEMMKLFGAYAGNPLPPPRTIQVIEGEDAVSE